LNYPKNKYEWKSICNKLNIKNENEYFNNIEKYNLPYMPEELYIDLISFDELNI